MARDDVTDALDGKPPDPPEIDLVSRAKLALNDIGNGCRLTIALKGEAIRVAGRGYGVWDGTRYNFEEGAARMLALGGCLQRLHEEEAAAISTRPVPAGEITTFMADTGEADRAVAERKIKAARAKRRRDFGKICGNVARIRAAVDMAAAAFLIDGALLDADRSILQVGNGTLDLDAIATIPEAEDPDEKTARWRGALRPHDRSVLATRLAGCDFDPEAEAPEWERFIGLVEPDEESRNYLKRCLGVVLGGQVGEMWLILLGKGGNGKSTLIKAIEAVLGTYAEACRIEMFLEHRNASGTGPTPEEAVLPGARVYTTHEPKQGSTLDAGIIKGLTGGDRRQANPKNKSLFNYIPVGVPILQANKMPNVNDPSEGFWRRVYPIMFGQALHKLPKAEQRTEAQMRQFIERERSGILNWLLEGYAEFHAIGLMPPAKVRQLKNSLRALADPLGQFLADKTRQGTGLQARTSELHRAFKSWCEAEGYVPMGAKAFTTSMLALDYLREKSTGGHWYWKRVELVDRSLLDGESGS